MHSSEHMGINNGKIGTARAPHVHHIPLILLHGQTKHSSSLQSPAEPRVRNIPVGNIGSVLPFVLLSILFPLVIRVLRFTVLLTTLAPDYFRCRIVYNL
jgi:hypothetical protein